MDDEELRRNPEDTWTSDALSRGDITAVMQRVLNDPTYLASHDFVAATPLKTAVGFGDAELVGFMLEHGADPNAEVDDGYTCLLLAIESELTPSLQIVFTLINAGADVNRPGIHGWTPLHMAAARGLVEKARSLIDAGADVNRRLEIDAGETPLMEAASQGRAETVRHLLECGADPSMRDTIHGRTPFESAQYAMKGPDPSVLDHLQDPDHRRMFDELRSQLEQDLYEHSGLSPRMIETLKAEFGKIDPAEQYRLAAE